MTREGTGRAACPVCGYTYVNHLGYCFRCHHRPRSWRNAASLYFSRLTPRQRNLARLLWERADWVTRDELATALGITRQRIVQLANDLINAGHVKRRPSTRLAHQLGRVPYEYRYARA